MFVNVIPVVSMAQKLRNKLKVSRVFFLAAPFDGVNRAPPQG
jgi:hypothetical protein